MKQSQTKQTKATGRSAKAVKPLDHGAVVFVPSDVDISTGAPAPASAITAVAADPLHPNTAEVNTGIEPDRTKSNRPKSKTRKARSTCWCGCGGETSSKFMPGHDARLKGVLIRVARGKADPSTIPAIARLHASEIGFIGTKPEYETAMRLVSPVMQPAKSAK